MFERMDQPFQIDAVEPPRLLGEAQPLAAQHAQPGFGGGQLRLQERARRRSGSAAPPRTRREARLQLEHRGRQARLRLRGLASRRRAPFGRAVIGVDIAIVALADLELQPDIIARDRVEIVGRSAAAVGTQPASRATGEEERREGAEVSEVSASIEQKKSRPTASRAKFTKFTTWNGSRERVVPHGMRKAGLRRGEFGGHRARLTEQIPTLEETAMRSVRCDRRDRAPG